MRPSPSRPPGLSAFVRCRNEEEYIVASLLSSYRVFDEIVVILNNSTDRTRELVEDLMTDHPAIRLVEYPQECAAAGAGYLEAVEKNPERSLAAYYNWSLAQTRFSHVCKWDGDMIALPDFAGVRDLIATEDVVFINGWDVLDQPTVDYEARIFRYDPAHTHYEDWDLYEVLKYDYSRSARLEPKCYLHMKLVKREWVHREWSSPNVLATRPYPAPGPSAAGTRGVLSKLRNGVRTTARHSRASARDRWLDFWHALPPFRGRLAIARIVAEHLLTGRGNSVAWAKLANGFRMKVDLRWKGGCDVLYYFRTYEEGLSSLIRHAVDVPGATLIDVGANIGAFCFLAADVLRARGGRAFAVEPLPQNVAFFEESLRENDLSDVIELLPVAVGDAEGTLLLEELRSGEIANARPLTWANSAAAPEAASVPMTTIDRLVQEHEILNVQFVKLDIEGAELFALRGARELLAQQRPLVYAELHREFMAANGTTFEEVAAFAASVGYDLKFLRRDGRVTDVPTEPGSRFLDAVLVPNTPSTHQRAVLG